MAIIINPNQIYNKTVTYVNDNVIKKSSWDYNKLEDYQLAVANKNGIVYASSDGSYRYVDNAGRISKSSSYICYSLYVEIEITDDLNYDAESFIGTDEGYTEFLQRGVYYKEASNLQKSFISLNGNYNLSNSNSDKLSIRKVYYYKGEYEDDGLTPQNLIDFISAFTLGDFGETTLIVLKDYCDENHISLIISYMVQSTSGGITTYLTSLNYSVLFMAMRTNVETYGDKKNYIVSSNELSLMKSLGDIDDFIGTRYSDPNLIVNNQVVLSVNGNVITANRQIASPTELSVKVKTIKSGENKYTTLTIPSGSTTSSESMTLASGETNKGIISVAPFYDDQYVYYAQTKQLSRFVSDKIVNNYNTGKITAVLDCLIDNYYDENQTKVITKFGSENDGQGVKMPMYFSNNDIVRPKKIRMVEIGGKIEQQTCDLVEGRIFRVVAVKVKYDGVVSQELTLQEEKT